MATRSDLSAFESFDEVAVVIDLTASDGLSLSTPAWRWDVGDPPGWDAYLRDAVITAHLRSDNATLAVIRIKPRWSYEKTLASLVLAMAEVTLRHLRIPGAPQTSLAPHHPIRASGSVRVLWQHLRSGLETLMNRLFVFDEWGIGVSEALTPADLIEGRLPALRWIRATPRLNYVADPFLFKREGSLFLIAEEYTEGGKGKLVEGRLQLDRTMVWTDAIEERFHLSYPFCLETPTGTYLLPEAGASGTLRLYEMRPAGGWQYVQTLLDIPALDPTVIQHDGRWWLFLTRADRLGMEMLYAYHSERLSGPWQPHALNPLKCDISSARPAGGFFRVGNRLFRPAQNCEMTYGGALMIQEITELGPKSFAERTVCELRPGADWKLRDGLHHLVLTEEWIVIDAKRSRFDPSVFVRRFLVRRSMQDTTSG